MPRPIKLLLLIIAGLASAAAQAQLLGPAFESGITLTQEDLDKMRQTVNQQIHGKPVGTTASWSNPNSKNSGTIKLLQKFTARNMRCEKVGYTLQTTAMAAAPTRGKFVAEIIVPSSRSSLFHASGRGVRPLGRRGAGSPRRIRNVAS